MEELAERLRTATKEAHQATERTAMAQLFRPPQLTRPRYARYLHALYAVYSELERQLLRHQSEPLLAPLYFPELRRAPALAADLALLAGPQALAEPPSLAAQAFQARLQHLGDHQPLLLLAHSYTRYLGDLSGGQLLRKLLGRGLELPSDDGLAFLHFAEIADPEAFKQQFRRRLNALPLSPEEAEALIAEAQHSFVLTGAIFESL